ncbi:DUF3427 domain-containing protein [Corynebacterium sp. SCR221107]|uniref:DUF3427 domain-containing protein n=1 Tax=Corynebacterium sp. SCR221107 TaxID=3017361 RepID=UPI0022EC6529|nr:DUF3427 domain-containing protein [Corynebacterium sp. SCR221107]WBT09762.1 DUF3427 domain-containing protein [Corynebacterium sp. SCR221107]
MASRDSKASRDSALALGIYETPVTKRIKERLEATHEQHPFYAEEVHALSKPDDDLRPRFNDAIAREFSIRLEARLSELKDQSDRIHLINTLASLLDEDSVVDSEQLLTSIRQSALEAAPRPPELPLSSLALLTNARNESNLHIELRRELETADSVDLLLAFIKTSGLRVLHDPLAKLRDRGIPFRVITTTYCGASDKAAIDRLVNEYGAEVKVSYESSMTRLHAKAWLFRRNSGFDTAYIGSSNLSNSALVSGMEWNVRTSSGKSPEIVNKFIATFDTYWADKHFLSYNPKTDGEQLRKALQRERFAGDPTASEITIAGLTVTPFPYQQEMLEDLQAEREQHDRHKNLLVAATGTGKTIVAALDYRNMCDKLSRRPKLLFVAHRKEILSQALRSFREVLKDGSFGELLVDGMEPKQWTHVFASIQSLNSSRLEKLAKDHFEFIIIDEFHHAEASTYRRVLNYFTPKELLGLTATPELGDGANVMEFFDYRVAHELRIWDALSLQLLAPMQYFGVNDGTDLQQVEWDKRKREYSTAALNDLYVARGNQRAKIILQNLEKYAFDLSSIKALAFCVSIEHATFMNAYFNEMGVPSAVLTGQSTADERNRTLTELRSGAIKVVFSVDLFNEGLDIPEINTVLLLRPTQSPVLFLQQIGRGLRLSPGKESCLILDFVGLHNSEFDMERRFRALTGLGGRRLVQQAEADFPLLPAGSSISLDKLTKEQVLQNLKQVTKATSKRIVELARITRTTSLTDFLGDTGLSVFEIYRPTNASWTYYLSEANLIDRYEAKKDPLVNRVRAFVHVNDLERAREYTRLLNPDGPSFGNLSQSEKAYARMFLLNIWGNRPLASVPDSFENALDQVRRNTNFCTELTELLKIQVEESKANPKGLTGPLANSPLRSHARYSLAELMGALKDDELKKLASLPREGVCYLPDQGTDLFLVTLNKDERHFTETTSYKDYPISPDLFHWESQSQTSLKSKTAQRYIHHKELSHSLLLAVRSSNNNSLGLAEAFTLLGQAEYVSHKNEKPIQFELRLHREMPQRLFLEGRTVA